MEISLILAEEVVKLFLIMAMGWATVKLRLLKSDDSRVISAVLIYVVTPCVIIGAFQIEASPQVARGLLFSLAAAAGSQGFFLLLSELLGRLMRLDTAERLTIVYTNAGILVFPLVRALLGGDYVVYSCAFVVVQLTLIWTHCLSVIVGRAGADLRKILLNINIISIAAGGVMFAAGLSLPRIVTDTLDMTASMVGPLGMLLAGMVIADVPLRDVFCDRRHYFTAALRLIAAPLILLALFKLCGASLLTAEWKKILLVVYLACVTPAAVIVTSMTQLYRGDAGSTGILYVLTTLLSIFTMPLLIGLFELVI